MHDGILCVYLLTFIGITSICCYSCKNSTVLKWAIARLSTNKPSLGTFSVIVLCIQRDRLLSELFVPKHAIFRKDVSGNRAVNPTNVMQPLKYGSAEQN